MTLEIAYYPNLVCGNAVSTILDKGVGKEASLLRYPPPPLSPLSPLSMLDFPQNKMVAFLPTLNMGEGGHKSMLFPK